MSKNKKTAPSKTQASPTKKRVPLVYALIGSVCVAAIIALILILTCCNGGNDPAPGTPSDDSASGTTYYADIVIQDYGTITVKLDHDAAPITVDNFVKLARSGFYDGLTFHRIIEGFMMQGGASTTQKADTIVGEFESNGHDNPLLHTRGAISMARTSIPDSATSQFFIVHQDSPHLNGQYACFGYVIDGIEVVDAICESAKPTDGNGSIAEGDRPVIETITIRTSPDA
ncbi:MAG: peptidylprolyl isomerase [Oscillospiraceae bacterium]|nr:peptidylprolyl isomerase [Oscillospiraceae bacterium]